MKTLVLDSYAKLNLYLRVLNTREDNYHNLKTLFARIDLKDKIILRLRRDSQIKIICRHPDVPVDETNLCYRSAKLIQNEYNIGKGIDIEIIKRIPVASGLGGGSSNAAATLLGIDKLWQLKLPRSKIAKLARKIGADVPFFIYNTTLAEGRGRGDIIKPIFSKQPVRLWFLLAVPAIKVSTPLIFTAWDKAKVALTRQKNNVNITNLARVKSPGRFLTGLLFNDLERVTTKLYPQVKTVKEEFLKAGLGANLMSGSGAAVFGIVPSAGKALSLLRRIKRKHNTWRLFAVKTV